MLVSMDEFFDNFGLLESWAGRSIYPPIISCVSDPRVDTGFTKSPAGIRREGFELIKIGYHRI
jgi:hypothetical protein